MSKAALKSEIKKKYFLNTNNISLVYQKTELTISKEEKAEKMFINFSIGTLVPIVVVSSQNKIHTDQILLT